MSGGASVVSSWSSRWAAARGEASSVSMLPEQAAQRFGYVFTAELRWKTETRKEGVFGVPVARKEDTTERLRLGEAFSVALEDMLLAWGKMNGMRSRRGEEFIVYL